MGQTLQNKIALVTGGAGGIGSAICRKLADEGASVVVTYNSNAEKAENLLKTLNGDNHTIFHAPTTDAERVGLLADFVKTKYGKLDILVNNAGITTPIPHANLEELTDEWIDKIMQTNVRGTFAMVRAFEKLLKSPPTPEGGDSTDAPPLGAGGLGLGLIVNISSVAAITGIGSNIAYCASKAAIDSMTRSLARALAPDIRVVSVSPGFVEGEYTKSFDPAFLKMQLDGTPLNRFATPEDVADAVYVLTTYLRFTTGSIIAVDGGKPLK